LTPSDRHAGSIGEGKANVKKEQQLRTRFTNTIKARLESLAGERCLPQDRGH